MEESQTARPAKDDIDPELVALARPRAAVGPLLVASVVGLSAYVMITLRADLGYRLSSGQPRDLGPAAAALQSPPDNTYVTIQATPDGSATARVRGHQGAGHRLAPALGTNGRLWLHVAGDGLSTPPTYDTYFTGRLRRLADLTFADELRAHVDATPPAPRFVDPSAIAAAKAGKPLRDRAGDDVSVASDRRVEIQERVEGVAVVTVYATESMADEAAARAALSGALAVPLAAPLRGSEQAWTWEAPAPAGLEDLRARLAGLKMWNVTVERKVASHAGAWNDLSVDASGALRLGGGAVPAASVERVAVFAPRTLPADVWVLLEGETPGVYWYVPFLYGAFALLSALLLWALVRTLRADRDRVPYDGA